MVPVDDETLQMKRKNLSPGKKFRSKQGETVLNNVNTTLITTAIAMDDKRPPCCSHTNGISEHLIPATLHLRNNVRNPCTY